MDKRNNRCKDASPYDTIRKASQFLAELDLLVYEEWKEPINGIYSVYLRIDKTNIFVNGKGSSRKFALASGYGELMERLQNMVYFRFSLYYDEILENNNVLIEQEDVLTEEVRMCANQNRWWNINGASEEMNQKIYEVWRNYYQTFNRKIRNAEYINIFNSKDKICIPYKMAEYYYGTNGMAAGNSLEETMVQALSEILERYAIKKCIEEKIRVPDITEYACKKYAFVNEARLEFESYGYRLHIKDLSVIDGIPGISVVICNNSFKYFVATGVHPVEEIAIERTITEICQGKDMNRLDFLINALNPQRISKYKTDM